MYIPGTCTHIFFAFAKVNDDFTAGAYDDEDTSSGPKGGYYKRVNDLKLQQPGLKTILSFGGWSAGTKTFKVSLGDFWRLQYQGKDFRNLPRMQIIEKVL